MEEMVTLFLPFFFYVSYLCRKKEVEMKYKLIICLFATMLVSCECPYQDADRINTSTKGDTFYAEKLLGTWQCYYPMIIGGVEFKEIKFMSNGKADITMAKQYSTARYTETYDYAYYGSTLRFSKTGRNFTFKVEGYLFPELYLMDSLSRYTMAKRKSDGC